MTRISGGLFRLAMLAFPRDFRSRYAAEMLAVFQERAADRAAIRVFSESIGAVAAGARMRLESAHVRNSTAMIGIAAMMIATTFVLRDVPSGLQSNRIDFSAEDPAGPFTLTVVDDKPVAATVDNVPLRASQILTRGDSVILLSGDGTVAVAMAFDAVRDSISWNARDGKSR